MRELGTPFDAEDFHAYPVLDGAEVISVVSKFDFVARFVFTPAQIVAPYDERRTAGHVTSSDFD
jgi:hypothetical protein